jgi:hypothetical protein
MVAIARSKRCWGQCNKEPVHWGLPPFDEGRRQQKEALAACAGETLPDVQEVWLLGARALTGAQVGEQRIWFNPILHTRSAPVVAHVCKE